MNAPHPYLGVDGKFDLVPFRKRIGDINHQIGGREIDGFSAEALVVVVGGRRCGRGGVILGQQVRPVVKSVHHDGD